MTGIKAAVRVQRLTVTQPHWLDGTCQGAAITVAAIVRRDGTVIGTTTSEPCCIAEYGRLISISGQTHAPINVRKRQP